MKAQLNTIETIVSFNGADYFIVKNENGWLEVNGPDKFQFTRDNNYRWQFTKEIDADLAINLKVKAIFFHLV
ncbi:hypothetical protein FRZ67_11525 [Panacibacter ginsenosidivorans]|uniref:Uncharacterized protein n=1 Tax=Panacibacter ginsenosidivorans TaxID=1813871 RepID=A0A5B8VC93_9BACT|nr:hypothetical protein [Panacibacter ginsenosidivorans]QEC67898.1 hypothetical protein FRZ67_11525 [Panacibacter ginsenosidivorans]